MTEARTRVCTKCGKEEEFSANRELTQFYRHTAGRAKDGYLSRCKICVQAEMAARRRRNPEPHRERARQWQQDHPEEYKARQKVYRTNFREELNAYKRRLRREDATQRNRLDAYTFVYRAVKTGKLVRATACQQCKVADVQLQAHHHRGYDKEHRLDVLWLCRPCHEEADKALARN